MITPKRLIVLSAVLATVVITSTAATASTLNFPGLPWGTTPRGTVAEPRVAVVDGATLAVNAVYGDPLQTTISYTLSGQPADGQSGSIASGTRLVLSNGSILELRWNATDPARPSVGTMIFPGLPDGDNQVTLEVDGLTFASRKVTARFAVPLRIDTRTAYQDSRSSQQVLQGGSGETAITIHAITRTPMAVLVEGTFDGLNTAAIQSFGRPDVWLVDSTGARVLTDSGRLGFGDGDRQFQFYFPAVEPGPAQLEFAKFPTSGAGPGPAMGVVIP